MCVCACVFFLSLSYFMCRAESSQTLTCFPPQQQELPINPKNNIYIYIYIYVDIEVYMLLHKISNYGM